MLMAEGQDRSLVWIPVANQLDACKPAHGENVYQVLLHGRVPDCIILLQQMNQQPRRQ